MGLDDANTVIAIYCRNQLLRDLSIVILVSLPIEKKDSRALCPALESSFT